MNATLAVARAFGDAALKLPPNPVLLCDPEITKCVIEPADQFVLIACDGLFDVMSSDQACSYIVNHLAHGSPDIVAQQLVNHAVGVLKSFDNVSVLLAMISPLRTIHESRLPKEHRASLIPTLDSTLPIEELFPQSTVQQSDQEPESSLPSDNSAGTQYHLAPPVVSHTYKTRGVLVCL